MHFGRFFARPVQSSHRRARSRAQCRQPLALHRDGGRARRRWRFPRSSVPARSEFRAACLRPATSPFDDPRLGAKRRRRRQALRDFQAEPEGPFRGRRPHASPRRPWRRSALRRRAPRAAQSRAIPKREGRTKTSVEARCTAEEPPNGMKAKRGSWSSPSRAARAPSSVRSGPSPITATFASGRRERMRGAASMSAWIPFCSLSTAIEAASSPPSANRAVGASGVIGAGHAAHPFLTIVKRCSAIPIRRACLHSSSETQMSWAVRVAREHSRGSLRRPGAEVRTDRQRESSGGCIRTEHAERLPTNRPITPAFAE